MKLQHKSVLVTGCSTGGIGAAVALEFAKQGHLVFATARSPSKIEPDLVNMPNVEVLSLDVSDLNSISQAVGAATAKAQGRLDILVNNAGINYTMPVLDASVVDGKRLFDTNFWGVMSLCQALAPHLIQAKGVIVNVSSIAGLLNTPYMGLYSASKAALTCLSETMRLELAPLGVTVTTVIAGNVETQFWQKEADFSLPLTSYYSQIQDTIAIAASGEKSGARSSMNEFARQIRAAAMAKTSGPVWKGALAGSVRWISKFVPARMLDRALSEGRGLDSLSEATTRDNYRKTY